LSIHSRNLFRKSPHGKPRCRWEDNIKIVPREIGCEGVDSFQLAQLRIKWQAFVNMVMKLGLNKSKEFIEYFSM
jgi:hypothetical protein